MFQSRYQAASHFRGSSSVQPRVRSPMFQSRYRAASHFRFLLTRNITSPQDMFQSRYRAASHFRKDRRYQLQRVLHVSISLSSGFSFQATDGGRVNGDARTVFPSRYRAASHFRPTAFHTQTQRSRFNLVIERLLISGKGIYFVDTVATAMFQSRYRAAFHFRLALLPARRETLRRFNLVIERLFISGGRQWHAHRCGSVIVSISLSSGFSFQAHPSQKSRGVPSPSFNLVIERLFISGRRAISGENGRLTGFNLVIERLFISGRLPALPSCHPRMPVSISLSSGFSFQAAVVVSVPAPAFSSSFNLVIERLFISGVRCVSTMRACALSFNLVIERLFISGDLNQDASERRCPVSISLSSGFSFQGLRGLFPQLRQCSFNLVIERLFISGASDARTLVQSWIVSISLSSGFSFQVHRASEHRRVSLVSISLSSGFSFQVVKDAAFIPRVQKFQSRYRAASHFRESD